MATHDLSTFLGRVEAALDFIGRRKVDLAHHLGISKQALGQILNGDRPGFQYRGKIADFCEVELQWLLTGSNPPDWAKAASAESDAEVRRLKTTVNALADQLAAAKEEIAALRSQLAELERQKRDERKGPRAADQ